MEIREQREGDASEALGPGFVTELGINGDTQDLGVSGFELREERVEAGDLDASGRRKVEWVEDKQDVLAARVRGELLLRVEVAVQLELGRLGSGCDEGQSIEGRGMCRNCCRHSATSREYRTGAPGWLSCPPASDRIVRGRPGLVRCRCGRGPGAGRSRRSGERPGWGEPPYLGSGSSGPGRVAGTIQLEASREFPLEPTTSSPLRCALRCRRELNRAPTPGAPFSSPWPRNSNDTGNPGLPRRLGNCGSWRARK